MTYVFDEDQQPLYPTIWFKHGCTNCFPSTEQSKTDASRFEGLPLPLVQSMFKGNLLGWLKGNRQLSGVFSLNLSVQLRPPTQFARDIRSLDYPFADTKNFPTPVIKLLDSDLEEVVLRVNGTGNS